MNFLFLFPTTTPIAETISEHWDSPGVLFAKVAAIAALVGLNGFFVAAEFALVKVRRSQLDILTAEGNRRAAAGRHVIENLTAYLSACQLGITLASLGLGWLGEPFLARILQPLFFRLGIESAAVITSISFAIAFSIITALHIVLGEQAPKILAIQKSFATTLFVSPPLRLFYAVFKPFIWFLNASSNWILEHIFRMPSIRRGELAHTEEELRLILSESAKAKEVSPLEKELLINALDLGERVVRDIMTPRGEVVFLDLEDSFETNVKRQSNRDTRVFLFAGKISITRSASFTSRNSCP